jgi:hypothetical protein
MVFEQSRSAVYRYILKRFEMALGLGLILLVAINEAMLTELMAGLIFCALVLLSIPSVVKGVRAMQGAKLTITDDTLTLATTNKSKEYNLKDFKILLYKKSANKVTSFAIMAENQGVKIEYYQGMNEIFSLLSQSVSMRKKIPWWQRL